MRIDWLNLDDVFDFLVIILMENKKDRAMTVGGPPVYGVREVCSWQMGSKDRRSIILPYTTHGQRGLYTQDLTIEVDPSPETGTVLWLPELGAEVRFSFAQRAGRQAARSLGLTGFHPMLTARFPSPSPDVGESEGERRTSVRGQGKGDTRTRRTDSGATTGR